jgi:hypothetical protein
MDVPPAARTLPVPFARRAEMIAERITYVARPGVRALPSGALALSAFAGLQLWTMVVLLWAIWWPRPTTTSGWVFSVGTTSLLVGLAIGVVILLLRRYPGFLLAVMRAPFVRLTVTDRRVLWTVPWGRSPLMEIGRERILGGILGLVDDKGVGNAALVLVPGDPSADIDGNIHFDRLPDAPGFIAALRGL